MVTWILWLILWVMIGERLVALVTLLTTKNPLEWPYLGRGLLWPLGLALVLAEYLMPAGDIDGAVGIWRYFHKTEGDDETSLDDMPEKAAPSVPGEDDDDECPF